METRITVLLDRDELNELEELLKFLVVSAPGEPDSGQNSVISLISKLYSALMNANGETTNPEKLKGELLRTIRCQNNSSGN